MEQRHWMANETLRVGKRIAELFPGVEIAVWDISEFFKAFQDVRRNIVFIQAEKDALKPILQAAAMDKSFKNYLFYLGERKPMTVNETWAKAKSDEIHNVAVILEGHNFIEPINLPGWPENLITLPLEYQASEIVTHALRGQLPITPEEAVNALAWLMQHKEETGTDIVVLRTYAQRNYQGWLVDYVWYQLNRGKPISTPERPSNGMVMKAENILGEKYRDNGSRVARAIAQVEELT